MSLTETKTFFNDNSKIFDIKLTTENLKLLTSYSENIKNYKNVITKDNSAANIGKPNTTPDSAPYQDPGPSPAPSVSPNETELIGGAPEIKAPNAVIIQVDNGKKVNVLENEDSYKFCARGAKTILRDVFGFPYFAAPSAATVPSDVKFKEYFAEIQKPASFQNGDVYVIGGFPGHRNGHMAVFMNGTWYSDFKQKRINVYSSRSDSYIEGITKYFRPKKYMNGAPAVKISGAPSSSYNANISKPESSRASEFEGKLNGNQNQKEKKTEAVVVKTQENKDSQPVNTHGMAEELFLIKIDNLGFVC